MLRADGHYIVGSGAPWNWQFAGGATEFTRDTFETLARRGAFESAPAGTTDLLVAWLEAIRLEHINFKCEMGGTEVKDDGTAGRQYMMGSIDRVCDASAILCKKLEARAIQEEFEEKQRNDPRNWPPLLQEYEAFKSIRDLRAGQHEQIPESFVRDSISRRLGITPEEVTWKQIRHEVSGLLRRYPAITVMPSQTPTAEVTTPESEPSNNEESVAESTTPHPSAPRAETIAAQIQRLREECRLTTEELAEKIGIEARSVQRHLAGTIPYDRHLRAYESLFSKLLNRKIVINKMS